MSAVDYILQEAPVGYGLYEVVQQPDTIGNRLKEVQEAANDLAKFGKMVKLVSFAPFQWVSHRARYQSLALALTANLEVLPKRSRMQMTSRKASPVPTSCRFWN
jgi:hypothetical protein